MAAYTMHAGITTASISLYDDPTVVSTEIKTFQRCSSCYFNKSGTEKSRHTPSVYPNVTPRCE